MFWSKKKEKPRFAKNLFEAHFQGFPMPELTYWGECTNGDIFQLPDFERSAFSSRSFLFTLDKRYRTNFVNLIVRDDSGNDWLTMPMEQDMHQLKAIIKLN